MKFLVFQHVPHEHPGLLQELADAERIEFDRVELWKPHPIPSLSGYGALIVMGGPMSVYDADEVYTSKMDEIKAIQSALKNKVPVLGICLGSQLLAHALGASVHPNVIDGRRTKEIGYHDVTLTEEGKNSKLFSGFASPITVFQWHGDAFDLPEGAALLATSPLCRNQAFACGTAYGLLFHFEFAPDMVKRQIALDKEWIHQDHELDEERLLEDAQHNADLMKKHCRTFFHNFLSIITMH
ncbi:MAG: type 1 glutamine amidotransferase [Candidatus Aenigmarchaeota archaeon]|nr:type 1 glutamine amidotransferase [Candidatus Aenigmarchaeota archaeon]